MKKIILVSLVVFLLGIVGIFYFFFFSQEERRARFIRNNEDKVLVGMSMPMVKDILLEPDTIYMSFDWGPPTAKPVKVLEYYRGFASADNLRVLIKGDTVINVVLNY